MKTTQKSIYKEIKSLEEANRHFRDIDSDLVEIFNALHGRVSFGAGTTDTKGENIAGKFYVFTSDGSANTEFSVTHTLGYIPVSYIVLGKDAAGDLYQLADTGTAWTSTTVYFKSTGTSVSYRIFLF